MSIQDHIERMEQSKTIGNNFEWSEFKKLIDALQKSNVKYQNKNSKLKARVRNNE